MACGCAIVATDVGDTRMFINNNNGILINLRLDELVSAIEKLYIDSGLAVKLGNFAYNYVREKHTIENMANYYISIFEKVYKKIN